MVIEEGRKEVEWGAVGPLYLLVKPESSERRPTGPGQRIDRPTDPYFTSYYYGMDTVHRRL